MHSVLMSKQILIWFNFPSHLIIIGYFYGNNAYIKHEGKPLQKNRNFVLFSGTNKLLFICIADLKCVLKYRWKIDLYNDENKNIKHFLIEII